MHQSKRMEKNQKKLKRFFMYIRITLCVAIVAVAIALKTSDSPVISEFSEKVSKEFEVGEAVEAISGKTPDEGVKEVFEEEKSPEKEYDFEEFYAGDKLRENEEMKTAAEEKKKQLEIETLSYQMSEEELSDDTAAEPFRIPPPSYCSYKNEKIGFKYTTPLRGTITSRYGYRDHPIIEDASFHTGLDIAAKQGVEIVSFASGKVVEAGKNSTYGNYILIEHSNGFYSFYGHNSKLLVKKGQKVSLGQKIAKVGSTGMSTGPHLHFEVRKGSLRLDPVYYITDESV